MGAGFRAGRSALIEPAVVQGLEADPAGPAVDDSVVIWVVPTTVGPYVEVIDTDSGQFGTRFRFLTPGMYRIDFVVTATTLNAGAAITMKTCVSLGGAGDGTFTPTPNINSNGVFATCGPATLPLAMSSYALSIHATFRIRDQDTNDPLGQRNVLRMFMSNNANGPGAPNADIANTWFRIHRVVDQAV